MLELELSLLKCLINMKRTVWILTQDHGSPESVSEDNEYGGFESLVNVNALVNDMTEKRKQQRRSSVVPPHIAEELRVHAESSLSHDDMTLRKAAGMQESEQVQVSGSGWFVDLSV